MVKKYNLDTDGEKKLSEHFKVKEFACKDGSKDVYVDDDLIEVLERVRLYLAKPINILSGYRTKEYNEQCGGASNSYHCQGKAADIRCDGVGLTKLAIICAGLGAKGLGIYADTEHNFVHIDTREDLTVFREK